MDKDISATVLADLPEITDANSDSAEQSELDIISETDNGNPMDGSYEQYNGHSRHRYHSQDRQIDSTEVADEYHHQGHHQHSNDPAAHRHSSTSVANSFDQVAEEIAEDLNAIDLVTQVEEEDLRQMAEQIPERNQDRLFSSTEPGAEQTLSAEQHVDRGIHQNEYTEHGHRHEQVYESQQEQVYESQHEQVYESRHEHEELHEHDEMHDQEETHDYEQVQEHEEQHHVEEHHQQYSHEEHHQPHNDHYEAAEGHEHEHHYEGGHGDDDHRGNPDFMPHAPDSDGSIGPPPSFAFRTERLSRNVAEAMATIWDHFWTDDVRQITHIIKKRFSQLIPYFRRFLAHLVAFWGGITYIRRAIAAFIRVLNRDDRVKELLERIGWASATTLRVFLSMCAMVMSATLQFYHLMRDRIIPDTQRVIPILYYKAIMRLLRAAMHSPWSLILGPFSLTFHIDNEKLPDRYYLHDKLSIPAEDVTFASMHDIVQTVRESVYRTRYMYQPSESQSTPVNSHMTDEAPFPPPSAYSGPKYHHSHRSSGYGKENRNSQGPLTEMTNLDGDWNEEDHHQHHGHGHDHGHDHT